MHKLGAILFSVVILCPGSSRAQEQLPRFRSRAEVAVRTVRIVLTTKDGKPLEKPPSPNDIEVLEEGAKAEILDIERLFPPKQTSVPLAAAPEEASEPAKPRPIRQVAYFETTLLSTPGVREATRALDALAPKLVTRGSLEIVVADPEAKVFLGATKDVEEIRNALKRLSATVPGRDFLASERVQDANQGLSMSSSRARAASGQRPSVGANVDRNARKIGERIVIIGVMDRLSLWASKQEPEPGGIFILVSDGFDLDPDRFSERLSGEADVATIRPEPRGPDSQILAHLTGASSLLGSLGFAVFPLTVGPERFYGTAESNGGRAPINSASALEGAHIGMVFERREEPLIQAAVATGGEMSTTGGHLGESLDRLSESYLVTFQAARPADGKVHTLLVKSKRNDIVVRSPTSIAGGTAESVARALVLGILKGDAAPKELGVEAAMDPVVQKKSTIRLRIQLGKVPDLLAVTGEGRLRVSLAIAAGKEPPFVHHEEMPLVKKGEGRLYLYDSPVAGVAAGDRVAVLVEELETGYAGGTVLTIGTSAQKP